MATRPAGLSQTACKMVGRELQPHSTRERNARRPAGAPCNLSGREQLRSSSPTWPNFGQHRLHLVDIVQIWQTLSQQCTIPGLCWPYSGGRNHTELAESAPNAVRVGPTLDESGQTLPNSCIVQIWSNPGQILPTSGQTWPIAAEFVHGWSIPGQSWPKGRIWSKRPSSRRLRPRDGHKTKYDPKCPRDLGPAARPVRCKLMEPFFGHRSCELRSTLCLKSVCSTMGQCRITIDLVPI